MADVENTIYFVGTAGAGKSTLVAAYERWCREHGITTVTVNLDPGAEKLPYQPDIDIRDHIRLDAVMEEHGLGPNGAQIAAADMIALDLKTIQDELSTFRSDLVLIDTPGQLELFVFRLSGKLITDTLNPGRSVIAYLLDPYLARTATGFTSQLLLAATTQFRLQAPMVYLLSKADLVDGDSLDIIKQWVADPDALATDVLREEPDMSREMAAQATRLLETLGLENHLIPVTAVEGGEGLDDLYTQVQAVVGGAEDATPEYDTFLGPGQEEAK